jgi:hypothetical protein
MILHFHEEFRLPVSEVYPYFRTPSDWTRLFGFAGEVRDRGDGWYAVPLHRFPYPLVARITHDEPEQFVRWEFRGFWRGEGEARFSSRERGVDVDGYEELAVRCLGPLSPVLEKLVLERSFRAVWSVGWRRLRRREDAHRRRGD